YAAQNLLQGYVAPRGRRTTFGFTFARTLQSITPPLAPRTTISNQTSSDPVVVTQPLGQRYTLQYALSGGAYLLPSVLAPTGARTSYGWTGQRLVVLQDPGGQRTTLGYTTIAADQTTRLRVLKPPVGGPTTLAYDTAGRVQSVTNGLGRRTTLLWDGSGNRLSRAGGPPVARPSTP